MLKNRIVDILKNRSQEKSDAEMAQAAAKIERQKRLSNKEFQKVYESIWQAGPTVKYQNPGAKEKEKPHILETTLLFINENLWESQKTSPNIIKS